MKLTTRVSTLVLFLTSVAIAGCASNQPPPATAYAGETPGMQALIAQGVTSSASRFEEDLEEHASLPGTDVGYAVMNVVNPVAGVGRLGAIGISAVSLFMPDPANPKRISQIFGWMPASLADDQKAANRQFGEIIHEALKAALEEKLQPPYKIARSPATGIFDIRGGRCDEPNWHCRFNAQIWAKPERRPSPAFLGGGESWTWPNRVGSKQGVAATTLYWTVNERGGWNERTHALFNEVEIYQAMSRRLPRWAYVYLAPAGISVGPGERGGFLTTPIIFHQGMSLLL